MVAPYRLKQLGLDLPAGSHILPPEQARQLHDATELLDAAREEAARLVEKATTVYEAEKARGYAEGLRRAGEEAARQLVRETELLQVRLEALEAELADVVVDCVRAIMRDFDDRSVAFSLVRAALEKMRREKSLHLRVPPSLIKEVRAEIGLLRSEFAGIETIDVVVDQSLVPPRMILESGIGRIDLDVGQGIERLRSVLKSALSGEGGSDG